MATLTGNIVGAVRGVGYSPSPVAGTAGQPNQVIRRGHKVVAEQANYQAICWRLALPARRDIICC